MTETERRYPRWVFYLLMFLLTAVPCLLILGYAASRLEGVAADRVIRYAASHMPEKGKEFIYRILASKLPGLYRTLPEPRVARVLQPYSTKQFKGAEVTSNKAGMRDRRAYVPKPPGVFRIVCLGDSYVMGVGGPAEDRWSEQIEEILATLGVRPDGREVEVYSLGIGSWSALNEAVYLSSRISEYAPDLVLGLLVTNDISDTEGVTGVGHNTAAFTPEFRHYGSGVLQYGWPMNFGVLRRNFLNGGLGAESDSRWRTSLGAWKRLETLLAKQGGRLVLGVLRDALTPEHEALFIAAAKYYFSESGLTAPLITTDYFDHRLPHDPHPNRRGHRVLATHYLHLLAALDYLPLDSADLPPLAEGLDLESRHPADRDALVAAQRQAVERFLAEDIDFERLDEDAVVGFLGGIYPGDETPGRKLETLPYGTPKSAFLLKRRPGAGRISLEVEVPPRIELYPFELVMSLDGDPAATLRLESEAEAGRHLLSGPIPETPDTEVAVEVTLRTDSYWTTIDEATMRSYRLISVQQE